MISWVITMELYEREYFVSRLSLNYLEMRDDERDLLIRIIQPDAQIVFEGNRIYQESYEKAFDQEVFVDAEIVDFLIEHELWTSAKEKQLESIPEEMEDVKVRLFENFTHADSRRELRTKLRELQKTIDDLYSVRHFYDHITCHGFATYNKWNHVIEQTTKFPDGSDYDWQKAGLTEVVTYSQSEKLSDTMLRELAKSEPWRTTWLSSRKNGGVAFDTPGHLLTTERKGLILWSNMYDSINESPDCPSEDIVQDDDALDGWLIKQRRDREGVKAKKSIENKMSNEKIANAGEVFLVASTYEEAKKVDSINDPSARSAKRQRDRKLKKEGSLRQSDFSDVKRDLRTQANQNFIQTVRGN